MWTLPITTPKSKAPTLDHSANPEKAATRGGIPPSSRWRRRFRARPIFRSRLATELALDVVHEGTVRENAEEADAVAATRSLIKAWSDFLLEAEAEAAAREAEQGVAVLESERQRLDTALESLEAELAALEEADVAA